MQTKILVLYLLSTLILVGCSGNPVQTIEVTRLVPQTVEVTRIIPQPTTVSGLGTLATAEPSIKVPADSISVLMDSSYFDGFILLTQYYTLLDHGLYEESYQLLSTSQQKRYSFEEYKSFYTHDMKALEIRGIEPYDYWLAKQGVSASQIPADKLRYVVFLTSYHNGAAWNNGGTPIPDNVTGFETLILENGEWKIDEFNTSPWLTQP